MGYKPEQFLTHGHILNCLLIELVKKRNSNQSIQEFLLEFRDTIKPDNTDPVCYVISPPVIVAILYLTICVPKEKLKFKHPKSLLKNELFEQTGCPKIEYGKTINIETFLRRLRNSISHMRFDFINTGKIEFSDNNKDKTDFIKITYSLEGLQKLIYELPKMLIIG